MDATLHFTLPEDQESFEIAVNAVKYHDLVNDVLKTLRTCYKYSDSPDEVKNYAYKVRQEIIDTMIEQGLPTP